jgi:hypothetical protein
LNRTVKLLVPLPNDRVEGLGTKTKGFVGRGPAVLDHTPASVVPGYIQDGAKKIICDQVRSVKSSLFQT